MIIIIIIIIKIREITQSYHIFALFDPPQNRLFNDPCCKQASATEQLPDHGFCRPVTVSHMIGKS